VRPQNSRQSNPYLQDLVTPIPSLASCGSMPPLTSIGNELGAPQPHSLRVDLGCDCNGRLNFSLGVWTQFPQVMLFASSTCFRVRLPKRFDSLPTSRTVFPSQTEEWREPFLFAICWRAADPRFRGLDTPSLVAFPRNISLSSSARCEPLPT